MGRGTSVAGGGGIRRRRGGFTREPTKPSLVTPPPPSVVPLPAASAAGRQKAIALPPLRVEDDQGRGAVGEELPFGIGDSGFGGGDLAAPAEHPPLGADGAAAGADRAGEVHLGLDRRIAEPGG